MLTVKELIEQLKKMNENLPVRVRVDRRSGEVNEVRFEGNHVLLRAEE